MRHVKTQVEALEGDKVKAVVTVDEKAVDAKISQTYKDFARKYNFPGFRKGKAPRPVIDNALGAEAVLAVVTDELVNSAYPQVVEDERLFPVGQPQLEDDGALVEPGKPFTFTFEVDVRPTYELSSYEPVEVELPIAGATEEEVDAQIEALQQHYATFEDASAATKMKAENQADLAMEATDEKGAPIEFICTESRLCEPGTPLFSKAFDDEILGMKKGDTKTFTLDVPEDDTAVYLAGNAGQKVTFTVTMNSVKKKVVPAADDAWAKDTMGFEDMADLRKNVAESVSAQKDDLIPRMKENLVAAGLVDRLDAEVPAAMAEDEEAHLLQDFFGQLQRQGVSFDNYLMQQGISADQFKEDVKLQAADNIKQQLALDAWARHEGIEATDADVSEEFAKAGLDDPAKVEKEWRDQGRLYLIREGILRAKALDDAMAKAKVTEVDFAKRAKDKAKKDAKKGAKAE